MRLIRRELHLAQSVVLWVADLEGWVRDYVGSAVSGGDVDQAVDLERAATMPAIQRERCEHFLNQPGQDQFSRFWLKGAATVLAESASSPPQLPPTLRLYQSIPWSWNALL